MIIIIFADVMKNILICAVFISSVMVSAHAQVVETPVSVTDESASSVAVSPDDGPTSLLQSDFMPGTVNPRYIYIETQRMLNHPRFIFPSNPMTVNVAGIAPLAMWEGGGLVASGKRMTIPGLMGRESGALDFSQSYGALTLNVALGADKYGYFGGLVTSYSVSGEISYVFNETLSLTLFGSYYSVNPFIRAAYAPYIGSSTVGGYLGINFSEHWGVDVGVQSVYEPWRNGWDTRPIVAPYYKFDNGAKIEIDAGGIVYEILRNRNSSHFNPTMGPPVYMGPPPVAPHR